MTITDRSIALGIRAEAGELPAICERRAAGCPTYGALDYVNVDIAADVTVPPGIRRELDSVELDVVGHLAEVDLVGDVDDFVLDRVLRVARSLRCAWLMEDLGVWTWGAIVFGTHTLNPILDVASLARAAENIVRIQRRSGVRFLAENPALHFSCETIDLLAYMAELAERADSGLVFDIGRFVGYCVATRRDPYAYLRAFSRWSRVHEVHVGRFWMERRSRRLLGLDLLHEVLARADRVRAVTLEHENASFEVLAEDVAALQGVLGPSP